MNIELLEILATIGLFTIVGIIIIMFNFLLDNITGKIKTRKNEKLILKSNFKKGTTFLLDNKKVILKKDIPVRIKKIKCYKFYSPILQDNAFVGIDAKSKNNAELKFEKSLLDTFKLYPRMCESFIEYVDNEIKGEKSCGN